MMFKINGRMGHIASLPKSNYISVVSTILFPLVFSPSFNGRMGHIASLPKSNYISVVSTFLFHLVFSPSFNG